MSSNNSPKVLGEGQYLRLVAADGWEWAERHNCTNAVIVVPITRAGELVLIEQYRIPLGRDVLGLPAGLVGDEDDGDEAPLMAARRELHEETGFEATQWRRVLAGPSSPGLTDESFELYVATGAQKTGPGGGDESEQIRVHVIPLGEVEPWLASIQRRGIVIDPKVYLALYFAERHLAGQR